MTVWGGGFVWFSKMATNRPALFIQGACGDVNPLQHLHRSGYAGARGTGETLGNAVAAALRKDQRSAGSTGSTDVTVRTSVHKIRLPLQPLPDRDVALDFKSQQEGWLAELRGKVRAFDFATFDHLGYVCAHASTFELICRCTVVSTPERA